MAVAGRVHGRWQPGGQVAALATVSDTDADLPFNEKLKLQSTVGALSSAGVLFASDNEADAKAGLWKLEGSDGIEYWVGFDNLYVITRYNRSVMYALAVHQLGQEIALEVNGNAS